MESHQNSLLETVPEAHLRDIRLKVAVEVALKVGQMIEEARCRVKSVETKQSFADLVTETDKKVESIIFEELRRKFPEDKFIGEEGVGLAGSEPTKLTDDRTWIVDPIDGTMNFVHSSPHVAVCIGLAYKCRPVLGVVFCPAFRQLFTALDGKGAFCNGKTMKVDQVVSLKEALVCAEMGSDRSEEKRKCTFDNLQAISWKCHGIRCLGSAAMNICSVAMGQTSAYYEFGLHCWDMCAPAIILQEAGGYVSDTKGCQPLDLMDRRLLVASSKELAIELGGQLVNQIKLKRDDE